MEENKQIIQQVANAVVAGEININEGSRTWNNLYLKINKVIEVYYQPGGERIGSLKPKL